VDLAIILRTLGSLGLVLGLLAGALWLVRRFNLRLPGAVGSSGQRLELVERISLDPRRSVTLLRRDGREHLLLLAPEGHLVIESGIVQDAADTNASRRRRAEQEDRLRAQEMAIATAKDRFAQLVDRATNRLLEAAPNQILRRPLTLEPTRKAKQQTPCTPRARKSA